MTRFQLPTPALSRDPEASAFTSPHWSRAFQRELQDLFIWRRDQRHFKTDPIAEKDLKSLIDTACLAPSVGNAQPWRFVHVEDRGCRERVIDIFTAENTEAARIYSHERAKAYTDLKLEGLVRAPVHLAVFCDEEPSEGHGLGRQTMPEMLRYSVVCAVHTLWLAAHARGFGVGWVSILNPLAVRDCLDVPESWTLIAYLCIGWPEAAHSTPELERRAWQKRLASEAFVIKR